MTLGDRIVVMRDGLVQQCGAPLEVYDSPTNRFVAGFVGTPPMNFFEGRLAAANGGVAFDEGTVQLLLTDRQSDKLGGRIGQDVALGIRPEAMALVDEGRFAGVGNVLPVQISVVEPLGEKMDLYATTPRNPHVVARVDARRDVQIGQSIELHIDLEKIHVFATGETSANLLLGDGQTAD